MKETTVSVIGGAFNSAIAGNADDSDGTNGSYTFTVKISKGKGTEIISAEKTMMIIATPYVSQLVPITAFSNIIGTAKVGDELKAGNLTPSSATVNYQWKISDTLDGSYTNIVGATKSKYTIIVANTGKFIKVEATGTGIYTNTVISAATAAVVDLTDYTQNSNLTPIVFDFDKKSEKQEDIIATIYFGKNANNTSATLSSVKVEEVNLVKNVDYILELNDLTFKKEYLALQDIGELVILIEFSAGEHAILTIIINDTTDYTENSTLSPTNIIFDKNISEQEDVITTITFGKNPDNTEAILLSVKVEDDNLVVLTDYILDDNTLIIKKEYLVTMPLKEINVVVKFSAGVLATLTINIIDTTDYTENSIISPVNDTFDKKTSVQKDITTTVTFGKNANNSKATILEVKVAGLPLTINIDYLIVGNILTIKSEYLVTQNLGSIFITIEFSAGENFILTINIIDTTDYTENSILSSLTGIFDKKSSVQKDVVTLVTFGKNANNTLATLSSVKINDVLLIANTDYKLVGSTLTFKKEYLATKALGIFEITVEFSAGASSDFKVTIIDTTDYTVSSIISPVVGEFDKKIGLQKDIVTIVTFGKNANNTTSTLTSLKVNGLVLTVNSDYLLVGNTLTVKKEYLVTKTLGVITISIEFSEGTTKALTVTIIDTTDYTENSSISPGVAEFDINIDNQKDKMITLIYGKNANNSVATISKIKVGEATLTGNIDYIVFENTLTIKKEYLAMKTVGTVLIEVEFSAGISSTINVNIIDTTDYTENSSITPTVTEFDKNIAIQADVTVLIVFGKNADNTVATLSKLKVGEQELILGTDYTFIDNLINIKKEYLSVQSLGDIIVNMEFSAGTAATLTITIIDTTDYTEDSIISPVTANFDKNVEFQADIVSTITFGKNFNNSTATMLNIKNGDLILIEDTDYTLVSNTLTFKKVYLETMVNGLLEISVEFSAGSVATLTITIIDTTDYTENSSVSPEIENFNKEIDLQADVSFSVTFGKNANNTTATLISLKVDEFTLIEDTDYLLFGNVIIIYKGFLATQVVGDVSVIVEFSAGTSVTLTITVIDTTPLPPNGDLLDSVSSSSFIGILYKRDGNIYYKEQDNTDRWSDEALIALGTEGKVVIDNIGNLHYVYTTTNKIGYKIYDGLTWTDEVLIESLNIGGTGSCSKPDMAIDNNGKAHITYTDSYGSSDNIPKPDIMYATNTSGVFVISLIFQGYQDYSSSGSWSGSYYNKGSVITLNDNGDYFIMAHKYSIWKWSNGRDIWYALEIKSNLGTGAISAAVNDEVYEAISSDGKLLVLYKQGSFKTSEIIITGSTISLINTTDISTSSVSRFSSDGSNVLVGGISAGTLQIQYNESSRIYPYITVKGTVVSIINNNGEFYAVYTDSVDSNVKKILIEAPETYTVTFAPGTTGNDLADITGATNYVATDVATEGVSFIAPVLSYAGYTFQGWFTDIEGTSAYIPGANEITADIILYAKFTI